MEKKKNTDKFQGYPHYPDKEDITNAGNNNGKELMEDADNIIPPVFNNTVDGRDGNVSVESGTDADVTSEDLRTLNASEQNMDTMDDRNLMQSALDNVDDDGEPLNEDGRDDLTGTDLDIPGTDDDDADELIGEEDEENNYYSLGGDLHEGQEENKGD